MTDDMWSRPDAVVSVFVLWLLLMSVVVFISALVAYMHSSRRTSAGLCQRYPVASAEAQQADIDMAEEAERRGALAPSSMGRVGGVFASSSDSLTAYPEALRHSVTGMDEDAVLGNVVIADEAALAAMLEELLPVNAESAESCAGSGGSLPIQTCTLPKRNNFFTTLRSLISETTCTTRSRPHASSLDALQAGGFAFLASALPSPSLPRVSSEEDDSNDGVDCMHDADLFTLLDSWFSLSPEAVSAEKKDAGVCYYRCKPAHLLYGEAEYTL